MFERTFRAVSLAGVIAAACLATGPAWAMAMAHADLTFHDLAITPSAGTVQFTGPWILQAHANANFSGPPDIAMNGPGTAGLAATGTWTSASGTATDPAPTPPYLDVRAGATADGNIPDAVSGSATAEGRGTVRRDDPTLPSFFQVTGGTAGDPVSVSFSVLIDYGLNVTTDQNGLLAEARAIFGQELFGDDVGFVFVNGFNDLLSIGPNDHQVAGATSLLLTNTLDLHYGTLYTLLNEADAEIEVANVPEPDTFWLIASALPILYRNRIRRT